MKMCVYTSDKGVESLHRKCMECTPLLLMALEYVCECVMYATTNIPEYQFPHSLQSKSLL